MDWICKTCKSKMVPLLTSLYCPKCEMRKDEERKAGSFLFRAPNDCDHPSETHYVYDDLVWCRPCGKYIGKVKS